MRRFALAAAAAASLAFTTHAPAALHEYPFWVEVAPMPGSGVYATVAHNQGAAPVTVAVTLANRPAEAPWPVTAVVPAGGSVTLNTVTPQQFGNGLVAEFHRVGDARAQHSTNVIYRLPFPEDQRYRVVRAPRSNFRDPDWMSDLARGGVVFAMPAKAVVRAARAGTVIDLPTNQSRSSQPLLYESNAVTILHDDGTYAWYGPLLPATDGVPLELGQLVEAGASIGATQGPLFYFFVLRTVNATTVVSVTPTFRAPKNTSFLAEYAALLGAGDSQPGEIDVAPSPYPPLPPVLGNSGENRAIGLAVKSLVSEPAKTGAKGGKNNDVPLVEVPLFAWEEGAQATATAGPVSNAMASGRSGAGRKPGLPEPEPDREPGGIAVPLWGFFVFALAHVITVEFLKRIFERKQGGRRRSRWWR